MLEKLRKFMKNEGIALFILNSRAKSLQLVTGFSGSAGEIIVTEENVYLFVDGRYHIQADEQTDSAIVTVVKVGLDKSPPKALYEKLAELTKKEDKIGLISTKTTCSAFKELQKAVPDNIIVEYEFDPVLGVQEESAKLQKLKYVPPAISGRTTKEKIKLVKKYNEENGIELLLITNPEEIAYLTNLRGNENAYSSCVKAIAVVYKGKLYVFRQESKFDAFIKNISSKNVYYSPGATPLSVYRKIEEVSDTIVEIKDSYISEMKSIKTPEELAYISECYRRSDVVVTTAIAWLNKRLENGEKVSEKDLTDKVKSLFIEQGATDLSFATIAAAGTNTAIIHYSDPNPKTFIESGDLVLLDCGAYFEYGYATDQTRTFLLSGGKVVVNELQRRVYTAVLKGLLRGLNAEITTGFELDRVVREVVDANKPEGFSFAHSTGHGVGILVHEGPPRIAPAEIAKKDLKEGMVFTIEPGLYCEGWGGVRLENTAMIQDGNIKTLTRMGFDENLIDYDMLSEEEKNWLKNRT